MVCSTAAFMLASFHNDGIYFDQYILRTMSLVPFLAFRSSAPYSSYIRLGLLTRKWRFLSGKGRSRKFHVLSPQECRGTAPPRRERRTSTRICLQEARGGGLGAGAQSRTWAVLRIDSGTAGCGSG